MRRLYRLLLTVVVGVLLYVLLVKILGVGGAECLELLSSLNLPLLLLAIALRGCVPFLHSLELYLAMRVLGLTPRLIHIYRVVCASLGTEYVVPLGGVSEVVKTYGIVQEGFALRHAIVSVFLQRFMVSSAVALIGSAAITIIGSSKLLLLVILAWLVAVINLGLLLSFLGEYSWSRLVALSKRFAPKWLQRIVENEGPVSISNPSLLAVLAGVAVLERFTIVVAGYLSSLSAGLKLSFPLAIVFFDTLYTIIWILPMITPGQIGILEAVQLTIMKLSGIRGLLAAIIPIVSRIVIMVAEAPQYILSLATGLYSIIGRIESGGLNEVRRLFEET